MRRLARLCRQAHMHISSRRCLRMHTHRGTHTRQFAQVGTHMHVCLHRHAHTSALVLAQTFVCTLRHTYMRRRLSMCLCRGLRAHMYLPTAAHSRTLAQVHARADAHICLCIYARKHRQHALADMHTLMRRCFHMYPLACTHIFAGNTQVQVRCTGLKSIAADQSRFLANLFSLVEI